MKSVLITIFFVSLLATSAFSNDLDVMSFCFTMPNTETAVGSKSAFITYPGIESVTEQSEVEIKIYKNEQIVHSYTIHGLAAKNADTYRFALDTAEAGKYSSQLCLKNAGESDRCSQLSAPSTPMEIGKHGNDPYHKLTCKRIDSAGTITQLSTELKPISGYLSAQAITAMKENARTVIAKNNFDRNQQVRNIDNKNMAYFAVTLSAKDFRDWAKKNDKCKRRYRPMILTYIVDKDTKIIIARDRLSPYMPQSMYKKFLGLQKKSDSADDFEDVQNFDPESLTDAPIELLVDVSNVTEIKTYKVWHTICMVRMEGMGKGITRCAAPYIQDFEYSGVSP